MGGASSRASEPPVHPEAVIKEREHVPPYQGIFEVAGFTLHRTEEPSPQDPRLQHSNYYFQPHLSLLSSDPTSLLYVRVPPDSAAAASGGGRQLFVLTKPRRPGEEDEEDGDEMGGRRLSRLSFSDEGDSDDGTRSFRSGSGSGSFLSHPRHQQKPSFAGFSFAELKVKDSKCILCASAVMSDPHVVKSCGHAACFECWRNWLDNEHSCPECERPVELEDLMEADMCAICNRVLDAASAAAGQHWAPACGHQAHLQCWRRSMQELHKEVDGRRAIDCPGSNCDVIVFEAEVPFDAAAA